MFIMPRRQCSGAMVLGLSILAIASVSPFAGCSKNGPSTDFNLALHPDSSCASAPVACVRRLDVELRGVDDEPMQFWQLNFQIGGSAAALGNLPNRGQGRFRVVGVATATGPVTVFSGTSGMITFDPKNDQSVGVDVSCAQIADPCATSPTPTPTNTPPVFVIDTNANLVLGQQNFTSCSTNGNGGGAPNTLRESDGIFTDATNVYVADFTNARIATWKNKATLTNGKNIDFVIGHTSTSVTGSGTGGDNVFFQSARGVVGIPGGMIATDQNQNRAGIFLPVPTGDGPGIDFSIGQGSNTGNGNGTSTTRIDHPYGLAWNTSANGLWISDTNNNRVLGYGANTAAFSKNNAVATLVIGQQNFTSKNANRGNAPDGLGLSAPAHVASAGKRLYVADTGNNRVLVWNDITAAANGQPADFAIGQPNLTTVSVLNPPTAVSLSGPRGVSATTERLVIADSGNNRVLIWQPPPSTSADPATQVLGQPDFVTNTVNTGGTGNCGNLDSCPAVSPGPTAHSMRRPGAVWLDGNDLWVSDTCNRRALRFSAGP